MKHVSPRIVRVVRRRSNGVAGTMDAARTDFRDTMHEISGNNQWLEQGFPDREGVGAAEFSPSKHTRDPVYSTSTNTSTETPLASSVKSTQSTFSLQENTVSIMEPATSAGRHHAVPNDVMTRST